MLNHFDTIQDYLPNRDLDTGLEVKPGSYSLTDYTYAKLLSMLTSHPDRPIPAQLKHDLIAYYANPQAHIITKNDPLKWTEVQVNLKTLQAMKSIGSLDAIEQTAS
jgi:hypothetical protein